MSGNGKTEYSDKKELYGELTRILYGTGVTFDELTDEQKKKVQAIDVGADEGMKEAIREYCIKHHITHIKDI